jgi:adenosylcobinamide-GDP ribazoletransferase
MSRSFFIRFIKVCFQDWIASLGFLTRIPVFKWVHFEIFPPLNRIIWAFPLIGGLIGVVVGGGMEILSNITHFPPEIVAILGLIASVLLTGCFHEDGLADTADGLGGGQTPQRRLEIMRDSRLGTYGATALFLSLLLKYALWTFFIKQGSILTITLVSEAVSRSAMVLPSRLLPPAQNSGIGLSAHNPPWIYIFINLLTSLGILFLFIPWTVALCMLLGITITTVFMSWRSFVLVRGVSGDIYGALQQVGILILLLIQCYFTGS